MKEDKKENKGEFNYKKGRETKKTHFWSPNKRAYGKKRKRKRKKKKRKKEEQSKGMDLWSLVWNLSME